MTQPLREAPRGEDPRFLIRDNDAKFGRRFDAVTGATGIKILRAPIGAPDANAACGRFLRSVRNECLAHVIAPTEEHMASVLQSYCEYFNRDRPHQGIGQRIPDGLPEREATRGPESAEETPVLGGHHHVYRLAA